MHRRTLLGALALAALDPQLTQAQPRYPSKPVHMLIPFPPGQGSDVLARALSDRLSAVWGQPVVVDNRSGANGSLAAQGVGRAAPDGQTLLLTSNSPIVINPSLYKKLAYNVEADLRPVALLATTRMALVVNPALPVKTMNELIAYARANPGKLSYGSPGAGSTSHLSMEQFKHATKTDMVHVPYRGSAPAMTDLMSGNVQLMIDGFASSLPHAQTGRVRTLAISGEGESRYVPGVPTFDALGIKGIGSGWYGVLVPAATDARIVQKLNADFTAAATHPEIAGRLSALYLDPVPTMDAAAFGELIKRETAMWARTARALGMYRTE